MDALNHINLAWMGPASIAAGALGALVGWLLTRRQR